LETQNRGFEPLADSDQVPPSMNVA